MNSSAALGRPTWTRQAISRYEILAAGVILAATLVRLLICAFGWPQNDSDEGTMGLMALHILQRGEHPIFFYGQHYMGALEAYLGAAAFRLFGVSVLSLRLGVLLLFALFLASTYLLAALLYNRRVALVSVIVLGLGTREILFRQLEAAGGYSETLAFGSLAMLLASWLALTYHPTPSPKRRRVRRAIYVAWGLVVGLGVWSDVLILPFVVAAGALLVLFCWRELRAWTLVLMLAGFVLGAFPLIAYNVTAPPGQSSLQVFLQLRDAGGTGRAGVGVSPAQVIAGTLLVSLPAITGVNPLCPLNQQTSWPLTSASDGRTIVCTVVHGAWGVGVLALAVLAALAALGTLWGILRRTPDGWRKAWASLTEEERRLGTLAACRLALLAGATLTLASYITSPAPALDPWNTARYLLPLLIAAPVVLAPLVGASAAWWPRLNGQVPAAAGIGGMPGEAGRRRLDGIALAHRAGRYVLLGTVIGVLLLGIIQAFGMTLAAQAHNQQFAVFQRDLERLGATRIYSDYWTCDRIIFQSQERILCSVLGDDLRPGLNRYPAYAGKVAADPRAAYTFVEGSPQAQALAAAASDATWRQYQRMELDGYVVYLYQPALTTRSEHGL